VICGAVLIIGGVVMILMDIRSEGEIYIKTPIVEGKIRATYLGLLVIFLGVVLQLGAVLKTYPFGKKRRIIASGDFTLREEEDKGMARGLGERDQEE
jgi:hypothetical protein